MRRVGRGQGADLAPLPAAQNGGEILNGREGGGKEDRRPPPLHRLSQQVGGVDTVLFADHLCPPSLAEEDVPLVKELGDLEVAVDLKVKGEYRL